MVAQRRQNVIFMMQWDMRKRESHSSVEFSPWIKNKQTKKPKKKKKTKKKTKKKRGSQKKRRKKKKEEKKKKKQEARIDTLPVMHCLD